MFKNKIVLIAGLILLLWLPVGVIYNLVLERSALNLQVQADISDSSSGEQTMVGPVLVQQLEKRKATTPSTVQDEIVWQLNGAQQLTVNSDAQVEQRSRGLYRVRVYQSKHLMQAEFAPVAELPSTFLPEAVIGHEQLRRLDSYVAFSVSDVRGLSTLPQVKINGEPRDIIAGSGITGLPNGVRVLIHSDELRQGFKLELQLDLQGSRGIQLIPTGESTEWTMQSNWQDPAFVGRFLPQQREVRADGFSAKWQSTQLSNPSLASLIDCTTQAHCAVAGSSFAVDLVEAANPYQQNERAIKYAILVIVLSFAWFYLAEILQTKPLHLMQYLLVGLTLVMFYLLLLSLSEVVGFALAYGIASAACAALLAFYLSAALKSWARGGAMAGAYAVLQGLLYLILQAETFALLSGSLLMFVTLAALMVATRHIDWQQLMAKNSNPDALS